MPQKPKKSDAPVSADVRLAIIGSHAVGKSAISVRFLTKRFIGDYEQNTESTYRRAVQFGSQLISYDLRDAASLYYMRSPMAYVEWATAIAVVYSMADRASFITASTILDDIYNIIRTTGNNQLEPCVGVVANKKDLRHLRKVSKAEGRHLAKHYGIGYWEVSAADDYHSISAPLNSLIVESYLKAATVSNVTKMSTGSSKKKHSGDASRPSSVSTSRGSSQRSSCVDSADVENAPALIRSEEDTVKIETKIFSKWRKTAQDSKKSKEKIERRVGRDAAEKQRNSIEVIAQTNVEVPTSDKTSSVCSAPHFPPFAPDINNNSKALQKLDFLDEPGADVQNVLERNKLAKHGDIRRVAKTPGSKSGKWPRSCSFSHASAQERDARFRKFSDCGMLAQKAASLGTVGSFQIHNMAHSQTPRSKSDSNIYDHEESAISKEYLSSFDTDLPTCGTTSESAFSGLHFLTAGDQRCPLPGIPIGQKPVRSNQHCLDCKSDYYHDVTSTDSDGSCPLVKRELFTKPVILKVKPVQHMPLKPKILPYSTSALAASAMLTLEPELRALEASHIPNGPNCDKKSRWIQFKKEKQNVNWVSKQKQISDETRSAGESEKLLKTSSSSSSAIDDKVDPRRYDIRRKLSSIFKPSIRSES